MELLRKSVNSQKVKISVVIPAYNIANELTKCLESLCSQTMSYNLYEVIIVDDCSSDHTLEVARYYSSKGANIRCYELATNGGPGIARNRGVNEAKGEFIVFVDGDDLLPDHALETLAGISDKQHADVVTFNWAYIDNNKQSGKQESQRRDLNRFTDNKAELIRRFLSMNFDGSVIYTMTSKRLIDDNNIRFPKGLHEDISVIFKIYYCAKHIYREEKILYLKRKREVSIVNTISKGHIDGYFSSWVIIKKFLLDREGMSSIGSYMPYYMKGVAGLIALTLLKNLSLNASNPQLKNEIYSCIHERVQYYFSSDIIDYSLPDQTRYDKLSSCFYRNYQNSNGQRELAATNFESEATKLSLL
tara:strand:- start:80 stop:1159 length:1080 start_codon:yes stop_codon:yes gene_type:complete